MIIFFSATPPPSSPDILTTFIIGIVSGALIALAGGAVTYYFQRKSKLRDLRDDSKSILQYIHMVLCLRRAKLTNIPKALEARVSPNPKKISLSKIIFPSLAVTITQQDLQKILLHHKFSKSKSYPLTFQSIVTADGIYQKCASFDHVKEVEFS